MLTAKDIAARLRCGIWSARQKLAYWLSHQSNERLPRVVLYRSGGRGRPAYRVEPLSFFRWLRGESHAAIAA